MVESLQQSDPSPAVAQELMTAIQEPTAPAQCNGAPVFRLSHALRLVEGMWLKYSQGLSDQLAVAEMERTHESA